MMYMSESKMVVADALARIDSVLEAAPMQVQAVPQHPQDASVALQNVHFSYDEKTRSSRALRWRSSRDGLWLL